MNISLMWADRYLRNTLNLKFRNIVELACVVAGTFKISVNTTYWNFVGKLISEFSLPHLLGNVK